MTVSELIEALTALPPELQVCIRSCDDGVLAVDVAEVVRAWSPEPDIVLLRVAE